MKYVFAKKTDSSNIFTKLSYKPVFEDKTVQIYERTDFLPRANFIQTEKLPDNLNDVVNIIKDQKFKSEIKIKWINYGFMIKSLSMETPKNGYLLLSDSYFPGWQAEINNEKVSILANYSLLSVYVPAGKNIVSFEYRPRSFKYGKIVSLVSFIVWVFSFVVLVGKNSWKKRK